MMEEQKLKRIYMSGKHIDTTETNSLYVFLENDYFYASFIYNDEQIRLSLCLYDSFVVQVIDEISVWYCHDYIIEQQIEAIADALRTDEKK